MFCIIDKFIVLFSNFMSDVYFTEIPKVHFHNLFSMFVIAQCPLWINETPLR